MDFLVEYTLNQQGNQVLEKEWDRCKMIEHIVYAQMCVPYLLEYVYLQNGTFNIMN